MVWFMTGTKIPGKAKKNLQDKALAMRIINPDMKIILITCDPIRNGYELYGYEQYICVQN